MSKREQLKWAAEVLNEHEFKGQRTWKVVSPGCLISAIPFTACGLFEAVAIAEKLERYFDCPNPSTETDA